MKVITLAFLFAAHSAQAALVARWEGKDIRDQVGRHRLWISGNVGIGPRGYDFSGSNEQFAWTPDSPELHLSGSLSLSCWVYPRAFTSPFATSPAAQIMFRGDDRSAMDPYQISLARNGRFVFAIQSASESCALSADARLNTWTHLLGTLDATTGNMQFFVNGKLVEKTTTKVRPLIALDPRYHPGFSIGNTQNPAGPHRQPFDGIIRDARIYDAAVTPRQAMR